MFQCSECGRSTIYKARCLECQLFAIAATERAVVEAAMAESAAEMEDDAYRESIGHRSYNQRPRGKLISLGRAVSRAREARRAACAALAAARGGEGKA